MKPRLLALACALPLVACGGSSTTAKDLAVAPPGDMATKSSDLAVVSSPDLAVASHDLAVASNDLAVAAGDMAVIHTDMASSFLVVESCAEADYVDGTTDASKRVVTPWDTSLGKLCIHILAGQSVTWKGAKPIPNTDHPLEPHGGNSTAGNPIQNQAINTFPNVGTFGYDCSKHHSMMHGAILVTP